jgi:hypothetical protein
MADLPLSPAISPSRFCTATVVDFQSRYEPAAAADHAERERFAALDLPSSSVVI